MRWSEQRAASDAVIRVYDDAGQLIAGRQDECEKMRPTMPESEEERSLTLLCDIQQELANALNSVGGKQSRGAPRQLLLLLRRSREPYCRGLYLSPQIRAN
jgi:hypothetical protein